MQVTLTYIRFVALSAYAFSIGIEDIDVLASDGTFSPAKLTGLMLIIINLYGLLRQMKINVTALFNALPFFLVATIFTTANFTNFDNRSVTLIDWTLIGNVLILYFVLSTIIREQALIPRVLLSFAFGVILTCALGVFIFGPEVNDDGRATLFGANHNELGLKIAVAVAVLTVNLLDRRAHWITMVAFVGALGLLIYSLVSTGSRSAFLLAAIFSVSIFLRLRHFGRAYQWKAAAVGLFLILALSVFMVNSGTLAERFTTQAILTGGAGAGVEGAFGGRGEIWLFLLTILPEVSVLGIGRSGYESLNTLLFDGVLSPHNVLVETYIYGGVPALIIILGIFFRLLGISWRSVVAKDGAIMFICATAVIIQLLNAQFFHVKVVWFLYAILIGLNDNPRFRGWSRVDANRELVTNTRVSDRPIV